VLHRKKEYIFTISWGEYSGSDIKGRSFGLFEESIVLFRRGIIVSLYLNAGMVETISLEQFFFENSMDEN